MQIAFAESLLDRHLLGGARDLISICEGKSTFKGPEKEVVQTILQRIHGSLSGVQTALQGFEQAASVSMTGEDLSIRAQVS